jgi:hypothetical protein
MLGVAAQRHVRVVPSGRRGGPMKTVEQQVAIE